MTETKTTRPRIAGLDVVKIIAMLSVVVSHALNVLIAYKQDLPMSTICHSLTAGASPCSSWSAATCCLDAMR